MAFQKKQTEWQRQAGVGKCAVKTRFSHRRGYEMGGPEAGQDHYAEALTS